MSRNIVFLGAPGAGKGTQAEIISAKLNIPAISTGNILRAAVKAGTPVGLKAKAFMDAGKLVPDEVIIGIIAERLQQDDCKEGYILDGVPRTLGQAEAMDAAGVQIQYVISLDITDEEIEQRMTGRRVCEKCGAPYHVVAKPPVTEGVCDACGGKLVQRADDNPEVVRNRLAIYHAETEPVRDFYKAKGLLHSVNASGTEGIQKVTASILEALEV